MKRTLGLCVGAVLVLVFLLSSFPAWGQEATTSLRGVVMDQTGASVPDAKVTLSNEGVGYTRESTSAKDGAYELLQLPPGTYSLRVSAKGFKTFEQARLVLLVATPATVNVRLEIGEVSQVVTVTEASAPALNTTDATLGNAFGSLQMSSLPFDGRDPVAILSLQAGVVFFDTTNTNINTTNRHVSSGEDSRSGSVNGARSDQTNVTLDGVDNNDQLQGVAFQGALRATLESTEEFRVTTANGNADEGRSSGAQVDLVTKSGTNNYHGSVYEYNRNAVGRANNWFNKFSQLTSTPPLPNKPGGFVRNAFGASLGGPIKKDRFFFFGNYEGVRKAEAAQTIRSVPSDSMRDGVIMYQCATASACPGGIVPGLTAAHNVPAGFFGLRPADIVSMDPNCKANGGCTQPGVDNSAVISTLQKYPHANSDLVSDLNSQASDTVNIRTFTFPAGKPTKENTGIAKFDYNVTQNGNHKLFLRANYQDDHQYDVVQYPGQPPREVDTNGNKGLAVGYTAVLSSTRINDLHYGYVRQSLGLNGVNNSQLRIILRGIDDPQAYTRSVATIVPVHNLIDNFTWIKGKHTLQFGGNWRFVNNIRAGFDESFSDAEANSGFLNFTGIAGTGTSLDPGAFGFPAVNSSFFNSYDFGITAMTGLMTEIDAIYQRNKQGILLPQGTLIHRHFRENETEFYLQDSWRLKPNLTVTLGARYSLLQPPYETNGFQVAPTTSMHDFFVTRGIDQKKGIAFNENFTLNLSGPANGGKPYWGWDYKDIAPRAALAWSPDFHPSFLKAIFGQSGRSSIRLGYGIYYDHFGEGIINTFDRQGSFGLTSQKSNAAGTFSVDTVPRYIDQFTIPSALFPFAPAPPNGFPATPVADPLKGFAISWGLDDKLKTPYSHVVDFSIQRDLGHNYSVDFAYVGRLGRRLLINDDLFNPLDLTDPTSGVDYFTAATNFEKMIRAGTKDISQVAKVSFWEHFFPTATGLDPTALGCATNSTNIPGSQISATQVLYSIYLCVPAFPTSALQFVDTQCAPTGLSKLPCPTVNGKTGPFQFYNGQFSSLDAWSSIARSDYHAFEVSLRKRLSSGLQFDFNYTLSKSTDIGSDAERISVFEGGGFSSDIINPWNPNTQHALSDFDTTHQINANWVYQLPFGRGRRFASGVNQGLDAVIGGWQLSGLARWTSGFPFSVGNGFQFPTNFDLTGNGVFTGPTPKTGIFFVAPPGATSSSINAFADPAAALKSFRFGFPGEAGSRNILRGPGYFTVDMGLSKSWSLGEARALRLSWETYNITNSYRFDGATLSATLDTATSFGDYSKTIVDERKMQFALRFEF
ncbi:MAG: TonB-dependent receptor [Candidatus Acidiferrales bacterium]